MVSWKALGGAAVGGLAVFGLLLVVDTVLDPYLPAVNPDAYLWAGGFVAGAAGLLLYRWIDASTGWPLATGAAVGLAAFLLVLGVVMYTPLLVDPGHEAYPELVGETGFEGSWNNTTVATQLAERGFDVRTSRADLVAAERRGHNGTDVFLSLEPVPASGNETDLRLRGIYRPAEPRADADASRTWIQTHREELRDEFDRLGEALAADLDWRRTWGPTWRSAVALE